MIRHISRQHNKKDEKKKKCFKNKHSDTTKLFDNIIALTRQNYFTT